MPICLIACCIVSNINTIDDNYDQIDDDDDGYQQCRCRSSKSSKSGGLLKY